MSESEDSDDVSEVLSFFSRIGTEEPKYGEIDADKSDDSGDYFLEYDKVLAYERYEPTFEDTMMNHYIATMSGFIMTRCETKDILAVYSLSEDSTCSRSSSEISNWSDCDEKEAGIGQLHNSSLDQHRTSKNIPRSGGSRPLKSGKGLNGRSRKSCKEVDDDYKSTESSSSGMGSDASSVLLINCCDESKLYRWRLPLRDQSARIHFKSGSRYVGRLSLGLMEGKGVYCWPDGAYYKGKFEGNDAVGKGTLCWPNGDWYQGQMNANLRHGRGTMSIDGGRYFYKGDWNMSKKHGQGLMVYGDKCGWYSGDWFNGVREGYGVRFYSKMCVYMGDWKNDKQNGLGVMLWDNNDMYNGEWKDGVMEGVGSYVWEAFHNQQFVSYHQNWYHGEWRSGQRHGYGVMMLSSGAIIRGEWRCGLKSGWAEVLCTDGTLVVSHDLFLNDIPTLGGLRVPVRAFPPHQQALLLPKKRKRRKKKCLMEAIAYPPPQPQQDRETRRIPVNAPVQQLPLGKYLQMYAAAVAAAEDSCHPRHHQPDLLFEEKWLRAIITRRMHLLRRLYDTYSTLLAKEPIAGRPALIRLMLWVCLRDCGLYETGTTIVQMDAAMGYNSYPFDYVPMVTMVNYLLTLSWELYGKMGRMSSRVPGYLGATFDLFVRERVKYALSYPSDELLSSFGKVPLWSLYELFSSLSSSKDCLPVRDLLARMCPLPGTRFVPLLPPPSHHFSTIFTGGNTLQPGCGFPPGIQFDTWWSGGSDGCNLPGDEFLDFDKYLKTKNADLLLLGMIGSRRLIIEVIRACPPVECLQTGILNNQCQLSFLEFIDMIAGCVRSYRKLEEAYTTAVTRVAKGEDGGDSFHDPLHIPSDNSSDSLSSTPSAGSDCVLSPALSEVSSNLSPPTLAETSPPASPSLLSEFTSSSLSQTHDSSSLLESLPSPPSPSFKSSSSCASVHSPPSQVSITLCDSNDLSSPSGSEGSPPLSEDELKIRLSDLEGDSSDEGAPASQFQSSGTTLSHVYSFTSASVCSSPSYLTSYSHPGNTSESGSYVEDLPLSGDEGSCDSSKSPLNPPSPPENVISNEEESLPNACSITSLVSDLQSELSSPSNSFISRTSSDYEPSVCNLPVTPTVNINEHEKSEPEDIPPTHFEDPCSSSSLTMQQGFACCDQEAVPSIAKPCKKQSFDKIHFDTASSYSSQQPISSKKFEASPTIKPEEPKVSTTSSTNIESLPTALSSSTLSSSSTSLSSSVSTTPPTRRPRDFSSTNEECIPIDVYYRTFPSPKSSSSSSFFSSRSPSPQCSLKSSGSSSSSCFSDLSEDSDEELSRNINNKTI